MGTFKVGWSALPTAVRGYGLAMLAVLAAHSVMWPLRDTFHSLPTPLFYPAIAIATWYGGLGAGLLAVAVSTGLVNRLYAQGATDYTLSAPDLLHTLAFTVSALLVSGIAVEQRVSKREAEKAKRDAVRALSERAEAERRWITAANETPVKIWMSDATGAVWFNQRWLAFAGRTEAEERAWGFLERVHPDDQARVREVIATAHVTHQPFTVEFRMRRHDGAYRWMLDHGVPRFNEDGAFEGLIGTALDITVRKEAERALARFVEDKHNFVAVMSHELRTPLTAVIGYTELLIEGIPAPVPAVDVEYLERIDVAARNLLKQVESVLEFQDVQLGKVVASVQPCHPMDMLNDVLRLVMPEARKRNVKVMIDASYAPHAMQTDCALVRQVLEQLVMNALKFTKSGQVTVRCEEDGGFAQFMVIDTGCGIAADDMETIWEPLQQVRQAMTREVGGMGLGLSMARAMTNILGGTLTVESVVGRGSTFTLTLPLAPLQRLSA